MARTAVTSTADFVPKPIAEFLITTQRVASRYPSKRISYFYIDDQTRHGFLIDPGAQADELLNVIDGRGWTIGEPTTVGKEKFRP